MSEATARPFTPDYATPPGDTLAEWLDEQSMSQVELATRLGMSPGAVGQLVHGIAPLGTDTAVKLERVTGIPARIWTSLEAYYQDHAASIAGSALSTQGDTAQGV
ncbi:MAG TPA: helix-turn-helix domain-containing protein [Mycobacteriales bacterium]|nr:helix-turn-helix domain-containing protein [Mycobacteriales bacterium]